MILALILFAATYVLMLWLQQYRPWVALCSAVLFIVLGEAGVYEFSPAPRCRPWIIMCCS